MTHSCTKTRREKNRANKGTGGTQNAYRQTQTEHAEKESQKARADKAKPKRERERQSPNTAAAMHQTPKEQPAGSRTGRQQPRGQLELKGKQGLPKGKVDSPKKNVRRRRGSPLGLVLFRLKGDNPPGLTTKPPDDRRTPPSGEGINASHQRMAAAQGRKVGKNHECNKPKPRTPKERQTTRDTKTYPRHKEGRDDSGGR